RDKMVDGEKVDLKLKLVTNIENDTRKDAAEHIRTQLSDIKKGLGIHIDVELVAWEKIVENIIPKRDFDLLLIGYNIPEMPDLEFLFGSEGSHNFIGYADPDLDELILEARHSFEEEDVQNV